MFEIFKHTVFCSNIFNYKIHLTCLYNVYFLLYFLQKSADIRNKIDLLYVYIIICLYNMYIIIYDL